MIDPPHTPPDTLTPATPPPSPGRGRFHIPWLPDDPGLLRSALNSVAVRALGAVALFGSQMVLARVLGVQGYGDYVLALTWVSVLAALAPLGMDSASVRFIAAYRETGHDANLTAFLAATRRWAMAGTVVATVLMAVAVGIVAGHLRPQLLQVFLWGIAALPLMGLCQLLAGRLQASRRAVSAIAYQEVLRPLLTVGGVAALALLPAAHAGAAAAMVVTAAAAFLSATAMTLHVRPLLPSGPALAARAELRRDWLGTGLSQMFTVLAAIAMGQISVLMVGMMAGADQAGIYGAATRVSALTAFGLGVINPIAGPLFAEAWAGKSRERLAQLARFSAIAAVLLVIPIALMLGFGGSRIMAMFGKGFTPGHMALIFLVLGQTVNAACGSVGLLLNMTGHHHRVAMVFGVTATVNVVLNFLLIPPFGINGAAAATGLCMAAWNIILWVQVRAHLGIEPSILSIWPRKNA
ncbi:MAG: flippase [Nitrospirota bacterium]|nr:flippase [Nitrospirota bacterium]